MRSRTWLFVYGVTLGAIACRPAPGGPSMPSEVINCTAAAVSREWPAVYSQVQTCLATVLEHPFECLDSLPTALKVGIDTVACIVSSVGNEAAAQLGANSQDIVSARKSERARAWLETRGLRVQ